MLTNTAQLGAMTHSLGAQNARVQGAHRYGLQQAYRLDLDYIHRLWGGFTGR